jgi:hypothetical protein
MLQATESSPQLPVQRLPQHRIHLVLLLQQPIFLQQKEELLAEVLESHGKLLLPL